MPLQAMQAPAITKDLFSGYDIALDAISKSLANQASQIKLPYLGAQTAADLYAKQLANKIQEPIAQLATPFAQAALSKAQAEPTEILSKAEQERAAAHNLNTEAVINEFKRANPAYISPEAYLYSNPSFQQGFTGGGGSGASGGSNLTVNNLPEQTAGVGAALQAGSNQAAASPEATAPTGNGGTALQNYMPQTPRAPQNLMEAKGLQMRSAAISAQADTQKKLNDLNMMSYTGLPKESKKYIMAMGAGMGLRPDEMMQEIMKGKTVNDIARERRIPVDLVKPDYVATNEDIQRINGRKTALAAINVLDPIVTKGLAPYINQIKGLSPAQIADEIKGSNKERQIAFLEAYGLSTELSAMRGNALGLHLGKGLLADVNNKILANIHPFQKHLDPAVYAEAQRRIDRDLAMASDMQSNALSQIGYSPKAEQPQEAPAQEAPKEKYSKSWVRKNGKLVLE